MAITTTRLHRLVSHPKPHRQPNQPTLLDEHGTLRFQLNAVVEYLLDNGDLTMNDLGVAAQNLGWSDEDQAQFAQLIGYSVDGWSTLSYVSREKDRTVDWDNPTITRKATK